jgi:hypothetical protein
MIDACQGRYIGGGRGELASTSYYFGVLAKQTLALYNVRTSRR